jgi:streptomycin 6-kinase
VSGLGGGFIDGTPAGHATGVDDWLAGLSGLTTALVERWELELGRPFAGRSLGYTVAATRAGTDPVVLRITYPDGWFPEEVAALVHWDGDGAVELIDHDPRGAMLLERAVPGVDLRDGVDEGTAMMLAADVLERLWIAGPAEITRVADEVGRWAATFRDRNDALGAPVPRELADEAVASMEELIASPREELLLHGDLHLGNVLSAEREPWLAIGPKPLVGDREFDVTALIRDGAEELIGDADAGTRLQRRFDALTERLSCDRERSRAWSVAVTTDHALTCSEDGLHDVGARHLALAELLRGLRA